MRQVIASLVLALAAAGASTQTLVAESLVVTNLNDSGPNSLRDVVALANASPAADVTITFGVKGTLPLTSGPIRITRAMTIKGPGKFDLTIDGGNAFRIFDIIDSNPAGCPGPTAPTDYTVYLTDMRLTNGRPSDGKPGGAIWSDHSLTLNRLWVDKNAANQGGGLGVNIQYAGQSVVVDRSTIEDNVATTTGGDPGFAYSGGGIWVGPRCAFAVPPGLAQVGVFLLSLTDTEVCGNSVEAGPLWGLGGGVAHFGGGDLRIIDSKISKNVVTPPATPGSGVLFGGNVFALGARSVLVQGSEISYGKALKGAGLDVENFLQFGPMLPLTPVQIVNSTISKNEASGTGANGGAVSAFGKLQLQFYNSTLYGNRAPEGAVGGVYFDTGGGVPRPSGQFTSTINWSDGTTYDVGANPKVISMYSVSAANSLFGCLPPMATLAGSGNILGKDPMLARLAYNGAPTRTHALLPGSPAFDAGSNPLGLETDQRGAPFLRTRGARTDIGASEGLASPSLQGVFWGAPPKSQDGQGVFLNQQGAQGESVFGAGYIYDPFGLPSWLVFGLVLLTDGTYAGDAYTATGPSFADFNPGTAPQVAPRKVGTVTLKPRGSGDARISFALEYPAPGQAQARAEAPPSKAVLTVNKTFTLTRQVFGYPMPDCGPGTAAEQAAATNFQDIWWAFPAGSESGWGLTIAHQGDTLFVAWFTYGADGRALWMVFAANRTAPNVYSGNVFTATGPPFDAPVFDPSKVTGTPVGSATLTFANGSRGRFDYTVNGTTQSKEITRQLFAATGNVCR